MLKASSLDLRFRLHHGLGRVLSKSLACCSQSRSSSALSPVIRRANNAEHRPQPATSLSEVEIPDGQATSLTYSCPRSGKARRQLKSAKSGPSQRRVVEATVHKVCPSPSAVHALQKRFMAKPGRAQLYHAQNIDSKGHHQPQKADRKSGIRVREDTMNMSYIGLQVSSGDRKVSQNKTIGNVQTWLKEGFARKGSGVGRERKPDPKAPRLVQMKQKPTLRPVEHERAPAEEGDVEKTAHILALRNIIWSTTSAEEAWGAYESLLRLEREEAREESNSGQLRRVLSPTLLTRLSRILARAQPRTRQLFLRYLSLLSRLRQIRPFNLIYTWEWNTLINLAGNGFRKTTLDLYNAALDIYHDFVRASSSSELSADNSEATGAAPDSLQQRIKPDIYTYTTLLSIAMRTRHAPAVRHATALMNASGLKPSRVTYLSLARSRLESEGLNGVRDSLQMLSREGLEIGIDGVNIFIWAAGKEGQIESALKVYDALRWRVETIKRTTGHEGADISESSEGPPKTFPDGSIVIEGLSLSHTVLPDETTYTTLVQVLAYHGYLIQALRVFTDMLSVPINLPDGEEYYQPTDAIFRALFRGYARHGNAKWAIDNLKRNFGLYSREVEWDLERLHFLLDTFISMPEGTVKPRARDMYWAMVATEKCTDHDPRQCREVWVRLRGRFAFCLDGRMAELDRKYGQPD